MADYKELTDIIKHAKQIVFFGGAGVSTESDIPDFRGAKGLYQTEQSDGISPEEILHHDYFIRHPEKFYEYYRANMIYPHAEPNGAHRALAKLEKKKKLTAVVTQNIDGLHQKAGSVNVLELHGTTLRNFCMTCGKTYGTDKVLSCEGAPVCEVCGGLIRPDVVLYGEGLNGETWAKAKKAIGEADVLIVGGTSLTVYPAASLVADYHGEHLIILNRTRTPYDRFAELVIREPIGEVFDAIIDRI